MADSAHLTRAGAQRLRGDRRGAPRPDRRRLPPTRRAPRRKSAEAPTRSGRGGEPPRRLRSHPRRRRRRAAVTAGVAPATCADAGAASPSPSKAARRSAPSPRSTKQLAEARRRLREMTAILDTATDGVVVLDATGAIESVNASAEALFGLDAHEMVGRRFDELLDAGKPPVGARLSFGPSRQRRREPAQRGPRSGGCGRRRLDPALHDHGARFRARRGSASARCFAISRIGSASKRS